MFKQTIGCELKTKHIYICHVDNYIGAYNPYTDKVRYKSSEKFVEFIQEILNDFPDYTPHNVLNEGIENRIRKEIKSDEFKRVYLKEVGKEK